MLATDAMSCVRPLSFAFILLYIYILLSSLLGSLSLMSYTPVHPHSNRILNNPSVHKIYVFDLIIFNKKFVPLSYFFRFILCIHNISHRKDNNQICRLIIKSLNRRKNTFFGAVAFVCFFLKSKKKNKEQ